MIYLAVVRDSSITSDIFSVVFTVISFIIILVLAYFTTKFVANSSNKLNKGKNMKIIDILNLGNNKKIMLVKIIDKIYILGINNGGIDVIDTIHENKVIEKLESEPNSKPVFENHLFNKLSTLKSSKESTDEISFKNNNINISNLRERINHLKEKNVPHSKKDEE